MGEEIKVSVIIPTKNGGKYLSLLLKRLNEQTFKPKQILILDSASNDDTLKICKEYKVDFIQIDVKNFDHGGTRNFGASKAEGNLLVFMTQDAIFSDARGLENLIKPLNDNQIAASYGRQIAKEDANPIEMFVRSFNYPSERMVKGIEDLPKLGIKTFFFSNACSAIKKTAFIEVGGFPNRTIMNEDMFLAAKLIMKGYKIAYQADAVVYHSHNYSLSTQFKRYFDIGVFFSQNRWIKGIAKSEREGIRYLKEEILYLFAKGRTIWIPYALIDTTIRFFGYRMGLLEKKIPSFLKKRMSFNKLFWEYGSLLS